MVPKAFFYFIMVVALTHDNFTTPDIHKKHSSHYMIQMLHNLINPPLPPFITKAMKMKWVDKSICSKRKSLT
jgi:hypothetical protein